MNFFTDFMTNGKTYELQLDNSKENYDWDKLTKKLLGSQDAYNMMPDTMTASSLVFFSDCIMHIMRIIRILKFERGNCLLIGMGGSGRKSLTRLASYIRKYKCFEIEITKGYGVREFYEDLGNLLRQCGAEQEDVSFLFSDT